MQCFGSLKVRKIQFIFESDMSWPILPSGLIRTSDNCLESQPRSRRQAVDPPNRLETPALPPSRGEIRRPLVRGYQSLGRVLGSHSPTYTQGNDEAQVSSTQLAQFFPPIVFVRPFIIPRSAIPKGSSGGLNAGKDFPRSFGNEGPETPPCFYCGTRTTRDPGPDQFNREHNIPKIQGGNNSPENYLPSCRDCNLNKGGRSADEWYTLREGA